MIPTPASATAIRIDGHIIEGQSIDPQGHAVQVTVLQGGRSKNGYMYNEATLQIIARLLDGTHAYADHPRNDSDQQGRSVRDIVGFYHDARYVPPGPDTPHGRVDATLHILEAADWLWSIIREACALGHPDLIGLSIDIFGQWQLNEASKAREVTGVVSLNSCDIVTRPSAGGAFRRILHSAHPTPTPPSVGTRFSGSDRRFIAFPPLELPNALEHSRDQNFKTLHSNHPHPLQGDHAPMEINETPAQTESSAPLPASTAATTEEPARLQEQQHHLHALMQELQLERAQITLERRLLESTLPEPVKANVRARFQGRIFEQGELDTDLKAQQDMLAALSASGLIRGNAYEKPTVGQMITEGEKIQAAFDRMFDLEVDTGRLGLIRPFTSIREAYARVTGDPGVAGLSERSTLGAIRVAESAPIARISEADTTTASFSYLLGTSMNKRLLKDYQAWPAEWMRFTTIVPIRDFKQQSRVRLGAFGSLPIVAEDNAYSAVTLTDSAATYVPQKRGNLVTVSREVIVNDDLQAIKQIPTKLAVAAAYTLAEFVYAFLSGNANIYDGSALFTSGAPHNNLGAAALSTAAMQSGVTAMREQTNYAGKRLGLRPRFLVVPPELEWTSMVVTKSAGVPGSNNNDINPMLGYVVPIVSPQLSSSTQWFLVGDPREIDTIEIGFVGGQVNPALFIQDLPLFGLNFTQDVITYKVRHEYGGAVVDYRGLYRGI
ncbi:MAG TPA: Mu-like prophage major head subunit gpT family protein [Ktedonobacteraceae bacterium]|nr:Mu-like prophage major head subunit gpT family protein [Ktedonobacteraceae bacterium]